MNGKKWCPKIANMVHKEMQGNAVVKVAGRSPSFGNIEYWFDLYVSPESSYSVMLSSVDNRIHGMSFNPDRHIVYGWIADMDPYLDVHKIEVMKDEGDEYSLVHDFRPSSDIPDSPMEDRKDVIKAAAEVLVKKVKDESIKQIDLHENGDCHWAIVKHGACDHSYIVLVSYGGPALAVVDADVFDVNVAESWLREVDIDPLELVIENPDGSAIYFNADRYLKRKNMPMYGQDKYDLPDGMYLGLYDEKRGEPGPIIGPLWEATYTAKLGMKLDFYDYKSAKRYDLDREATLPVSDGKLCFNDEEYDSWSFIRIWDGAVDEDGCEQSRIISCECGMSVTMSDQESRWNADGFDWIRNIDIEGEVENEALYRCLKCGRLVVSNCVVTAKEED